MKITETDLAGVLIIEADVFEDERGFFIESYSRRRYATLPGLDVEFVQDNHSRSRKNVLRGLHMQRRNPQGKLVRVMTGHVWDVVVDVDPQSRTFRRWVGIDLTEDNRFQLYVPPGYAHGFCVLSDFADFEYKCTQYYSAGDEVGLLWNDPELDIRWPVSEPHLSKRDAANPRLRVFLEM
jgi:dTDP-4-dehydrorhamnose 3,5-epimerase